MKRKREPLAIEIIIKEYDRRFQRWQKRTERVRSVHLSLWVLAVVVLIGYGVWMTSLYSGALVKIDDIQASKDSESQQASAYKEDLETINENLDKGIESYKLALGASLGLTDAYLEGGWPEHDRTFEDSRFYYFSAVDYFTQAIKALENSGIREPGTNPFAPSGTGDALDT